VAEHILAIRNALGIIAEDKGSYAEGMNMFRAEAERGWFELNTAYDYTKTKGQTSTACSTSKWRAPQMDGVAQAI
jgi:hypothetical protein